MRAACQIIFCRPARERTLGIAGTLVPREVFEGNFAKQSVSLCRLGGIDNNHIFHFERFSGKVDRVENALKI